MHIQQHKIALQSAMQSLRSLIEDYSCLPPQEPITIEGIVSQLLPKFLNQHRAEVTELVEAFERNAQSRLQSEKEYYVARVWEHMQTHLHLVQSTQQVIDEQFSMGGTPAD